MTLESEIIFALAHGWSLKPAKESGRVFHLQPEEPTDPRQHWAATYQRIPVANPGAPDRPITIWVPDWFGTERAPFDLRSSH